MVKTISVLSLFASVSLSPGESTECCQAETASCKACKFGTTKEIICSEWPELDGCEEDEECSCDEDAEPPKSVCPPAKCAEWSHTRVETARCKWYMEESRIQVHNARIYSGWAGEMCPFDGPNGRGLLHHAACAACALQHKPCEGTFAACPGCCFTAGPGPNKTVMCDRVPQHHDCQDFQNWFFEHNSISLNCTDQVPAENVAEDLRLFLNNITVDVKEQTEHGVLEAKCEWDSDTAECKGIPIKLRLDCTDCAIKAVPELLQKCCDQGVEIANGPIMENLRRQGLAPQLWMDGCHSPTLEMPWYPYFVAFANYTKYSEYTEQRADEKMRTSVTNNYCSKGVPENASLCVDHPWHIVNARNENCQRRLRGDSSSPGSCQASVEAEEPEQANVYLAVPDASGNFEEVEMVVIDNKVDVTSRSTTSTTTTSTNDTGSHIDSNDQHDDTGSSSNNDSESSSASGPSTPLVGVLAIVLAGWL